MIERVRGNLLEANVDALLNPVNTDGVMGKGLALQIKNVFPDVFSLYQRACKSGEVTVGRMHVVPRQGSPRFVINFPTKTTWRKPSELDYIKDGLRDLVRVVPEQGIRSLALPPLGCGRGGLNWRAVEPLIVAAFERLPEVRVLLYEPAM
jgi:O-acetyl-ADP-ribose deacetylase (regulator of RNase III)